MTRYHGRTLTDRLHDRRRALDDGYSVEHEPDPDEGWTPGDLDAAADRAADADFAARMGGA